MHARDNWFLQDQTWNCETEVDGRAYYMCALKWPIMASESAQQHSMKNYVYSVVSVNCKHMNNVLTSSAPGMVY